MEKNQPHEAPRHGRRVDTGACLRRAREQSQLDAAELATFHESVRNLKETPDRVERQQMELTLANEELKSQHASLAEAYEVLQDEHTRNLELFDSTPDALVTTDDRGVIRRRAASRE